MRIAVTGASGGVGTALRERAPDEHDLVWLSRADLPVDDATAVDRLAAVRPDVILNLAAMTSVDACERDPEAAFRVNALGSAHVALAGRRAGAAVVALSTDYVFDGLKGAPYHEYDRVGPLSVYGASKLAGEREVRALAPEHLIVRTSWVFGSEGDFVSGAIRSLAGGDETGAVTDLYGTPTYAPNLAERLVPLAASGARGLVHLAGSERTTIFDLLARARDLGGLPGGLVEQKSDDLGRPAPRPRDSSLASLVLPGTGVPPMPPLDDAIRDLLERR